jgi:hypothetical protein
MPFLSDQSRLDLLNVLRDIRSAYAPTPDGTVEVKIGTRGKDLDALIYTLEAFDTEAFESHDAALIPGEDELAFRKAVDYATEQLGRPPSVHVAILQVIDHLRQRFLALVLRQGENEKRMDLFAERVSGAIIQALLEVDGDASVKLLDFFHQFSPADMDRLVKRIAQIAEQPLAFAAQGVEEEEGPRDLSKAGPETASDTDPETDHLEKFHASGLDVLRRMSQSREKDLTEEEARQQLADALGIDVSAIQIITFKD